MQPWRLFMLRASMTACLATVPDVIKYIGSKRTLVSRITDGEVSHLRNKEYLFLVGDGSTKLLADEDTTP